MDFFYYPCYRRGDKTAIRQYNSYHIYHATECDDKEKIDNGKCIPEYYTNNIG